MTTTAASQPDRSALFGQALDRLEAALARGLREAIPAVAADLERCGEAEPDQHERQSLYAVAAMLRIESRARVASAGRMLHERAHRCLEHLENAGDEQHALALIEEDELRLQILAAGLAATARGLGGADYELFSRRCRTLGPGLWEDDDANPLGVRTLAAAVLAAFLGLGETGAAAERLRSALASHLPPLLVEAVVEADRWLEAAGVRPLADAQEGRPPVEPRAPSQPDRPAAASLPLPVIPEPVPAGVATRAVDATDQAAQAAAALGASPLAVAPVRANLSLVPTLQPVLEIERDALALAHALGAVPYSREARAGFFRNARERLQGAGVPPAQLAVVDLVAAMFDYVVDDQRVPEAAKPLIWRLQQPTVALSLLDSAYLGDDPRSLRRLVENLGAIVNAFADDLTRGSELYRRLDTVVRAVEIVAGALQTRSAVIARQVEHEYERAARNVVQLVERVAQERSSLEAAPARRNRRDYSSRPDRAREQEVTERLSSLLAERLERHEVPDSVREFVLNVWLRHLRTAVLRDGEDSAEFKAAMQVVDDLLWSLHEGKERQSRSQLAQKIPPLIRLLAQGLRAIGARDEEFKPFFDELFLIHLRKMQRRSRSGDTRTGSAPSTRTGMGAVPSTGTGIGAAPSTRTGRRTRVRPDTGQEPQAPNLPHAPPAVPPPAVAPPATAGAASSPVRPTGAGEASGQRLLEVLASLDLGDLPRVPEPVTESADAALDALQRGQWLRLSGSDEPAVYAKVAWINARRTVVLLVRQPDRRAVSMQAAELLDRFRRGRAARIA